jgi:opacity protein-like surface antigen
MKLIVPLLTVTLMLAASGAVAADWEPPEPDEDALDWVKLSSLEWVRGTLELLQHEVLYFDSEEMGNLQFDWPDVIEIRTTRTVTVGFIDGSTASGPITLRDGVLKVRTVDGVKDYDRWQILAMIEGEPKEINYWSFLATANLVTRSGNTSQSDFNAFVRIRRQTTMTQANVEYRGNFGNVDGEETANNTRLDLNGKLFLTRKLFVTPLAIDFTNDKFQNLELRTGVTAGLGYYIIRAATDWQVGIGGGYQGTEYVSVAEGEDRSIDNGTITAGTKLEMDLTSDIELDAEYQVRRTFGADKRTLLHGYLMLSFDLIGDIIDFTASVTWDRNSNPKPNADGVVPDKDDLQMAYGLGVDF